MQRDTVWPNRDSSFYPSLQFLSPYATPNNISDDPHGLKQANQAQNPHHDNPNSSSGPPPTSNHSRYYSLSNATTMQAPSSEHTHLSKEADPHYALGQIRSAGSVSLSPELFEKLYLAPPSRVKGELRKTFGNPTPIAIIGHVIALGPLSCELMGWRGASPTGLAGVAIYFFFGGILMILGGVLEWILGNTFPSVVFTTFGAFWISFASTWIPAFNAYATFAPEGSPPTAGMTAPGFQSSYAFFFISMGILCVLYLVCALRTNLVYVAIFFTLAVAFGLFTAIYFLQAAKTSLDLASNMITGAGAVLFATTAFSWYILFAIMLEAMAFPFQLPVGDLSTRMFVVKHENDSV